MAGTSSGAASCGSAGASRACVAVLARERGGGYDAGSSDDLRSAVRDAAVAVRRVRDLALGDGEHEGELGALVELLSMLDAGHVAAVALADRAETGDLAPRRTGLPLEGLLAFKTRLTIGDRRTLVNVGAVLRGMPNLRAAFADGALGWAQVRAIVAEARVLDAPARGRLDGRFADQDRLLRQDPDAVLDEVRDDVGRLRPDLERTRKVRSIEHRFLHVQPALDGALTGYFELDAEAGATILAGLEAAMPAPSAGRRDVTRDAVGEGGTDPADQDEVSRGEPSESEPRLGVSRARQRADGLLRLAEAFLSGGHTMARARPRMNVVTDIATLLGEDELAGRSRLLWAAAGRRPSLTPEAVRRLASDADLRHILVDGSTVLGVAAPTEVIPRAVREAVLTRDQGCRFPGCRVPMQWLDLHHVHGRAKGGHTVVDNLVGLCRRHHVAVTEGRWRLTMSPDGVVTVRRGRHMATSDPPLGRRQVASRRDPPRAQPAGAAVPPLDDPGPSDDRGPSDDPGPSDDQAFDPLQQPRGGAGSADDLPF